MKKLAFTVLLLVVAVPAFCQSHPFVVTSPVNSATPFNVTLPSAFPDGRPARTAVIEYVTADCFTLTGIPSIGAAKLNVFFGSTNAIYSLPFEAPQSFVNSTEFISSQKTLIFANPGSQFSYGLSGGQPTCTVVFTGHLQ